MEKKELSPEQRDQLVKYCGNEQCVMLGWVTEIKKNKFFARFDRKGQESVQLEQKKKKLKKVKL